MVALRPTANPVMQKGRGRSSCVCRSGRWGFETSAGGQFFMWGWQQTVLQVSSLCVYSQLDFSFLLFTSPGSKE